MAKIPSGDPGDPPVSEAIASRDLAIEAAIEREDWDPTAALAMDQVYPHHELQCFDSARHYAELALEACSMTDLRATGLRKIELDALDMSALEHFYLGTSSRLPPTSLRPPTLLILALTSQRSSRESSGMVRPYRSRARRGLCSLTSRVELARTLYPA